MNNKTKEFITLVDSLCKRPGMYVMKGTFYEVCAYLTGYATASENCPLSGEGWKAFHEYVCVFFQFPNKYSWPYVIQRCTKDEDEAMKRLHELLTTFSERSQMLSFDKIVQELQNQIPKNCEGEPEKTWRRFFSALLKGRKEDIELLIQKNIDAHILWEGSYPEGVAIQLEEISASYPIRRISGTEDEGEVTIVDPDFGPISLKRIGSEWKIDAQKIIEIRNAVTGGRSKR